MGAVYRRWSDVPDNLATKTQLKAAGLKPGPDQKPAATFAGYRGNYDLFDRETAVAIRRLSPEAAERARASLEKARATGETAVSPPAGDDVRFSAGDENTPAALVIERRGAYNVWLHGRIVATGDGWHDEAAAAAVAHARQTYPHVNGYHECIALGYQIVADGETAVSPSS